MKTTEQDIKELLTHGEHLTLEMKKCRNTHVFWTSADGKLEIAKL